MGIKSVTIKDSSGNHYLIKDIRKFQKHLFQLHASGTSMHEEDGYYFRVDNKFRKMIDDLVKKV